MFSGRCLQRIRDASGQSRPGWKRTLAAALTEPSRKKPMDLTRSEIRVHDDSFAFSDYVDPERLSLLKVMAFIPQLTNQSPSCEARLKIQPSCILCRYLYLGMCSTYNILPEIDICLHELADSDLGVISEDPWFYSVLYVLRTPTQSFRSIIPCCQLTVAPSAYQLFHLSMNIALEPSMD